MSSELFTHVTSRPVVATDTAETIGSVKGFVLDRTGRHIESIHIDGRGKRAIVLPWSAVNSFGTDAVMASSGDDPATVENEHQKSAVTGDVTLIGTRILTTDGLDIGNVDDVEFETDSGAVIRIVTARGPLEAQRLRSLGSYALVVDPFPAPTG
ncbi:MAG: PRC-barrel domain-containing protein [Ilumatobacteraceae bacterium]